MGWTPQSAAEAAAYRSTREWLESWAARGWIESVAGFEGCYSVDRYSKILPRVNELEAAAVEEVSGPGWSCQLAYSHARRAVRDNLEAAVTNDWWR